MAQKNKTYQALDTQTILHRRIDSLLILVFSSDLFTFFFFFLEKKGVLPDLSFKSTICDPTVNKGVTSLSTQINTELEGAYTLNCFTDLLTHIETQDSKI